MATTAAAAEHTGKQTAAKRISSRQAWGLQAALQAGGEREGVWNERQWAAVIIPETMICGLLFCPFGSAIFPLPLAYSAAFGCVAAAKKRRAAGCNANPCHSLACRREIIPVIGGGWA